MVKFLLRKLLKAFTTLGFSILHGLHQLAQKSTSTYFPRNEERAILFPLTSGITISGAFLPTHKFYTVQGSPASAQLRDFIFGYTERRNAAQSEISKLDSLKTFQSDDTVLLNATNQKNRAVETLNNFSRQALEKSNDPFVATFILGIASSTLTQVEYEAELNRQLQKYPNDQSISYLKGKLEDR